MNGLYFEPDFISQCVETDDVKIIPPSLIINDILTIPLQDMKLLLEEWLAFICHLDINDMSITIKYKNLFGKEITENQVSSLDEYDKEYYEDGILKKIESYEDHIVDVGTYYLSPGEELNTLVNQFKDLWRLSFFYVSETSVGTCVVRDWKDYRGGVMQATGKSVFDEFGRKIATQILDINTLAVRYTKKHFFLSYFGNFIDAGDVNRFGTLDFIYDRRFSGDKEFLVNLPGFENKSYSLPTYQDVLLHPLIVPVFNWLEQTYYHNATPLVPGIVI
jgi:hypothetical protein